MCALKENTNLKHFKYVFIQILVVFNGAGATFVFFL